MTSRPFFSIGVTTYDRVELLKETLKSILAQTFTDFEVIIGNNNPSRVLTADLLGVDDPRITILNHKENLGQLGNMLTLQQHGSGRYITWIADDDLYAREFLEAGNQAILKFDYPECVFTGFQQGTQVPTEPIEFSGKERLTPGPSFLGEYLAGKLKTIGTMGLFRADYLEAGGGLEDLSRAPIAIYTEYLQIIKAGSLENVAFIDAPLVIYNIHEGSFSTSNSELEPFKRAQQNLIRRSLEVLRQPLLLPDFEHNLTCVFKFFLMDFTNALWRARVFTPRTFLRLLIESRSHLNPLKGTALYWRGMSSLLKAEAWLIGAVGQQKVKALTNRQPD